MRIEGIIWPRNFVDKIAFKHRIETYEVEEVLNDQSFALLKKESEPVKMSTSPWGRLMRDGI
jgi:hypothetical protein